MEVHNMAKVVDQYSLIMWLAVVRKCPYKAVLMTVTLETVHTRRMLVSDVTHVSGTLCNVIA